MVWATPNGHVAVTATHGEHRARVDQDWGDCYRPRWGGSTMKQAFAAQAKTLIVAVQLMVAVSCTNTAESSAKNNGSGAAAGASVAGSSSGGISGSNGAQAGGAVKPTSGEGEGGAAGAMSGGPGGSVGLSQGGTGSPSGSAGVGDNEAAGASGQANAGCPQAFPGHLSPCSSEQSGLVCQYATQSCTCSQGIRWNCL